MEMNCFLCGVGEKYAKLNMERKKLLLCGEVF